MLAEGALRLFNSQLPEPLLGNSHRVVSRRERQRDKTPAVIGGQRPGQIGVEVLDLDIRARHYRAVRVRYRTLNRASGDLRLGINHRGDSQNDKHTNTKSLDPSA